MSKYAGNIVTTGANAGYSVSFDGTGDYLSFTNNANTNLGTGDFTFEAWVYPSAISTYSMLFAAGGANNYFALKWGATASVFGINAYNGTQDVSSTLTTPIGQWVHVAFVRISGTIYLYINGVNSGSGAFASAWGASTGTATIGFNATYAGQYYVNGYLSNVRLIKGVGVYTANFTPPTQLLNVTNTSLLTCNSPAIVDQSSNNFTITVNGDAKVSTFTPFTGTQLVPNPNTMANTQGVWSIRDAAYWMAQNKWPMPPSYPLQSLRFNSADTAHLSWTPTVTGSTTKFTASVWTKLSSFGSVVAITGGGQSGIEFVINLNASGQLSWFEVDNNGQTTRAYVYTNAVFRDPSAFYHFVVAVDTSSAVATDRCKIWANGVLQAVTFSTTPSQNYTTYFSNNTLKRGIGAVAANHATYQLFNGLMTDFHWIDGQALTPASFGANNSVTGVWSPITYTGTYGTNGFRLSFQDNTGTTATTLGKDWSGQGNNWTPNNFSVTAGSGNDSLTDTPTNWGIDYGNGGEVRGNYCTLNPIAATAIANNSYTLTNGALDTTGTSATYYGFLSGTIEFDSGTTIGYYWEYTQTTYGSAGTHVGIYNSANFGSGMLPANSFMGGATTNTFGVTYRNDGFIGNLGTVTSGFTTWASAGDVIGVAVRNNKVWFSKNGVWLSGNPGAGTSASVTLPSSRLVVPAVGMILNAVGTINFGQRPFAYPAPSGFKTLCTQNLPAPAVVQSGTAFNVVLYTGNGATQSVTGVGFQPDLVWLKDRTAANSNALYDALRGVNKILSSNSSNGESTDTAALTSFNSNGFTLGSEPRTNTNGNAYVSWNWKANGAGSSNTAGSITSTASANTTAGISVVTWTGTSAIGTVGHGLGAAPKMIIAKSRSTANAWGVLHQSANAGAGQNGFLLLNSTAAFASDINAWNNTAPTSSVFSVANGGFNAGTMVAYCFAEVPGFSKFGSYIGNGSTDGPFVYCGFRPRWILVKPSSTGGPGYNWYIWDTSRSTYNAANLTLEPNLADADFSISVDMDILSNGFKLRASNASINASSVTYIFAAFAEAPFNYARAR